MPVALGLRIVAPRLSLLQGQAGAEHLFVTRTIGEEADNFVGHRLFLERVNAGFFIAVVENFGGHDEPLDTDIVWFISCRLILVSTDRHD